MSSKSSGGQVWGGGPDRAPAVQQLRPPVAQRREHALVRRTEEEAAGSAAAGRKRPSEGLDDSKLGQVAQLHVTERLPGTDDSRV